MAKTAATSISAEDERYCEQIERSLAEAHQILKELARERKEYARRNPPRPRIVDELKALLSK
ncbi:MAG TPA: hypothetical protein VGO11_12105 [Chthoniobacteraceae bacterium]|jgi:hypothetical protein|nr:hypothetical protein [Chthoniobacteraceae bacterium]